MDGMKGSWSSCPFLSSVRRISSRVLTCTHSPALRLRHSFIILLRYGAVICNRDADKPQIRFAAVVRAPATSLGDPGALYIRSPRGRTGANTRPRERYNSISIAL